MIGFVGAALLSLTLGWGQLVAQAQHAGFQGQNAYTIAAIAEAESSGYAYARHYDSNGSVDRGVLQFNNYAHPEVNDACADNPECAFREAFQLSRGTDFRAWATYDSGAYRNYFEDVEPVFVHPVINCVTSVPVLLQEQAYYYGGHLGFPAYYAWYWERGHRVTTVFHFFEFRLVREETDCDVWLR